MSVVQGIGRRLRQAIGQGAERRRDSESASDGSPCAIIAVAAQKGGVGKTTTAVHLAASLAADHGLRVLIIDLDNQSHVISSLRAHVRETAAHTISRVLLGEGPDLMQTILATDIEGLDLSAADKRLADTEAQLAGRIGRELLLRRAMWSARRRYDAVIMDCPPNLGLLTLNALMAADHVLIPCDLSILSLEGVDDLVQTLDSLERSFGGAPKLLGLVHTRVDRRNRHHNESVRQAVAERYGDNVLASEIGINTAVSRAQLLGQTVFRAWPEARGARDYRALATEVRSLVLPETTSQQAMSLAS